MKLFRSSGGVALVLLAGLASAAPTKPAKPANKVLPKGPATKKPGPMPPDKRPKPVPIGLTQLMQMHASEGYFDDPMAMTTDGKTIAMVKTDGDTFIRVEIWPIATTMTPDKPQPPPTAIDLKPFTLHPTEVAFLKDGRSLFIKEGSPDDASVRAQIYGPDGVVVRKYGPSNDIALTDANGVEAVVLYKERGTKTGTVYDVTATRSDDGKPIGKRSLTVDSEGTIKGSDLRVVFFSKNYLFIAAKKKGEFDKAKDLRLPDRNARYDVLAGKVVAETVVEDLIQDQKTLLLRRKFPNVSAFLKVADDLSKLQLYTADNKAHDIALADELIKYDPKSVQQTLSADEKRITFTLTIDPVNIIAVDKKIADIEYIDFYDLEVATAKATRIARLPAWGRPFAWRTSSGLIAVLRKHKGFDRGGPDLEVYQLTK